MAGSYILYKKLHHNGLMTDLGLLTSMFLCPQLWGELFVYHSKKEG